MNAVVLIAATSIGAGAAAVGGLLVPPRRRLADRIRAYTVLARSGLGHAPDLPPSEHAFTATGGAYARLFGPPVRVVLARVAPHGPAAGDERLARLLRQAGDDTSAEDFRIRQLGHGVTFAVIAAIAVGTLTHAPLAALVAGVAGHVVGSTRPRKRLERAVATRAARIRQELYTVNHLLAMHVRTGSGPIQAAQRVVDRGRGVVVDDMASLLAAIRHGVSEGDAFRRAAALTPEPGAARTFQLLAASAERGADLGEALLSLSEDLRDARREHLHKEAVRRRAAMLVPTIAILAPIMLLFIAAPIPSVVLGHR
jgi:Flp pilus assembly protein TadB